MCVCVSCGWFVPLCSQVLDLLDPHLTVCVCFRSNHRTTIKANRFAICATRLRWEERQEIKRGEVEEKNKNVIGEREREAMCYVRT